MFIYVNVHMDGIKNMFKELACVCVHGYKCKCGYRERKRERARERESAREEEIMNM